MEGNEQLAVIIPMLREVASGIDSDQLGGATPCADFTVEGVLDHMTGLASGFAPMFRGEDPAEHSSSPQALDSSALGRFDLAMGELLDAVQSPGALDRTIITPGGPMPGSVFARLVAFDGLVHGWDLATATQQDWRPPDGLLGEVDSFARQAITAEMRDGGGFASEQTPPAGASAMACLVAFTGRTIH